MTCASIYLCVFFFGQPTAFWFKSSFVGLFANLHDDSQPLAKTRDLNWDSGKHWSTSCSFLLPSSQFETPLHWFGKGSPPILKWRRLNEIAPNGFSLRTSSELLIRIIRNPQTLRNTPCNIHLLRLPVWNTWTKQPWLSHEDDLNIHPLVEKYLPPTTVVDSKLGRSPIANRSFSPKHLNWNSYQLSLNRMVNTHLSTAIATIYIYIYITIPT